MKRILYGLLAFFSLLIGLAFIAPFFIDVNQYKSEIISKAKEATGRDLMIEGPIQLSLFPSPALTLHQVKFANHPQAQKPYLIMFEKVSVKAAILPLLRKKIHITKVNLKEARIELEKLPGGGMNWELSIFSPENSRIESPSQPGQKNQEASSKSSFDLGVDKFTIQDATLTYREGQQETVIKDLSLEARLDSLTGPYTAEGQLQYQHQTIKFDIKTGKLAEALPLEAEFLLADSRMKIIGVYTQSSQAFKGSLDSQVDRKALQELTHKADLPHFAKDKIGLKALLEASPSRVMVKEMELKLGETIAKGTMTATLGNILQIEGKLGNLPGQGHIDFTAIQKPNDLQGQFKANIQHLKDFLTWLEIDTKDLPAPLLGQGLISTRYALTQETLHLRDLMLNLQGAQLQGEIDYKLNQKVPSMRVDLRTPKVENFMSREGAKAQKPLGAGRIKGSVQGSAKNLVFDVQTTLGSLTLGIKGQAQSLDKKPTLTVDVEGQTTNLGAFLVDLGFVSKSTYRNASLKGQLSGDLENLRLNAQTTLDGLSIATSGVVQKVTTIPTFNLKLNMAHPNVRTFLKLPSNTPILAQGAVSITVHLAGDTTQFTVDNFKTVISHDIDMTGKFDVNRKNDKTKIVGTLTATSLNLDLLLAAAENKQQLISDPHFMLVALRPLPSHHTWSQEPLSFHFLKDLETDVQVTIHKLKRKDIIITNLKVSPKVQNGILEAPITGTFSGGKVQANLRVTSDNTLSLRLDLKEADLASLVPHYSGQIKLVGGKFSLNSALTTRGKSMYELVFNLAGPIKMAAREGVINGFDLQAISQRLKQINNLQGLLGLLSNFMAKGKTTFKSFDGDILFKNGIGTIQSMQLIANGGAGQAAGTINLPSYLLNIATEFRLTDHPQLPPFKMYLTGPLDNPHRNLETQALQNYLIQNVFKGVVDQLTKGKGKVGDVLGAILGQDQGTGTPQTAPQPDEKQKPKDAEKVVKDLLKNLF
jgi:uncharacterized protein involved in outer membrane biogenesis